MWRYRHIVYGRKPFKKEVKGPTAETATAETVTAGENETEPNQDIPTAEQVKPAMGSSSGQPHKSPPVQGTAVGRDD